MGDDGKKMFYQNGSVAQLVEHLAFNQKVVGSSPTWATIYG